MTTDLARAWEKDEAVRTKGRKLEAVPWFTSEDCCFKTFIFYSIIYIYILIATAPASQVTVVGKVVTRDGLCQNERILIHAINHIGSRVGVDVVYLHLTALYEFMGVPIDRTKAAKSDYRFQAGMSQIQKYRCPENGMHSF